MKRDIRSLRAYHNISQQQLADAMGVSQNRIYVIEKDESVVSLGQLERIYNYLGYDLIVKEIKGV